MKNNAQFQKINEEILTKVAEAFLRPEFKKIIEETKAATDSGTFEIVISTADEDRQGEVIDQNGWDFTNYKNNPVVLWGHNYFDLPIGVTDEVFTNEKGQTIARGRFAPEAANPFAQQVRRLYDAKIVRTASVGFIVREMEGNTIMKAELLEFSFVPVPANPMALSLAKEFNFDAAELLTKGLFLKAEEEPASPPAEPTPEEAPKEEEKAAPTLTEQIGAELAALQAETESAINGHAKTIMSLVGAEAAGTEATEEAKTELTGRVRTMMSRTKIKIAINGMKATIAALEELLAGSAGIDDPDGDALKQRSNAAGLAELVEALKTFNANRQVLRMVNNITSESLKKINEKAREK